MPSAASLRVEKFRYRTSSCCPIISILPNPGTATDVGTGLFDVVAQLAQRQAVGGKGVHRTEHVTEFVVERRSLLPWGN